MSMMEDEQVKLSASEDSSSSKGKHKIAKRVSGASSVTEKIGQSTRLSSRKILQLRREGEGSDDDIDDVMQCFVNLSWNVHRVSPLFGFEDSEIRLKQYALRLRDYFANTRVIEDGEYTADFKVLKNVGRSKSDAVVKVSVRSSVEGNQRKLIYVGLLLSWGMSERNSDNYLQLPILMCRGRIQAQRVVHNALQRFFDCIITPFHFSQIDLIWLNSLILSLSIAGRAGKENLVRLILHPPGNPNVHCQYIMRFDDVKGVWKHIHPENSDVLTAEEVKILYNGLVEHISRTSKINLTSFILVGIHYREATVKANGKILCKSTEIINDVLVFLNYEFMFPNLEDNNTHTL